MNTIDGAVVGVAEHGNTAILVTVSQEGGVLDRRTVALSDGDLPTHPYHHEGSWAVGRYRDSPWARDISLSEAIELVERVEARAAVLAPRHLAELADDVSADISALTLRACPDLPDGIEARIRDNRAQTFADTVMYRQALADAARARAWSVLEYDGTAVLDDPRLAVGGQDVPARLKAMGRKLGAPWQAKHKLAAAAALLALHSLAS